MINVAVAYDDNDTNLGDYFEASYNQINNGIPNTNFIAIRGLDCTEANINSAVTTLNENPFVFIGLSHGDEDGQFLLTENGEVFVSEANATNFSNSFFYSTACNIAITLAPHLLAGGCQCFIGYNAPSWGSNEDFSSVYIECENYSINEFLRTDKTITQTYEEMRALFTQRIIEQTNAGEILVAIDLQKNLDCLEIQGNGALTRNNFNV